MTIHTLGSVAQGLAPLLNETSSSFPRTASGETARVAARPELPAGFVAPVGAETATARVEQAAESINKVIQALARNLEFSVDQETGITVVKVMDTQTNEVIRQIPGEEAIAIARALDKLQGLIVRERV